MFRPPPLIVLLAALSMAAECSPSAPPCDDAYGGKCPEGEHRHCLQYCIELGGLGDECNADPCALEPGQTVCRTGFVCVGGKCEASNAPPLMACKPAAGLGNEDSCSSGTYCRPIGDFAASLNCPGWYDPRGRDGSRGPSRTRTVSARLLRGMANVATEIGASRRGAG